MKYIYTHLGLGDHVICNGMVRYLRNKHGEVTVFCKANNHKNVQYMYRDDDKIKVFPLNSDSDVERYIRSNNLTKDTIRAGFVRRPDQRFDDVLYETAGVPFNARFDNFYIQRDLEREKEIYNTLNPNNEPYIFTHGVDMRRVRGDLKVIENPVEYLIFELIGILENSVEVHLMESSLKCLAGSIPMSKPKFFFHKYARDGLCDSQSINRFIIIQ